MIKQNIIPLSYDIFYKTNLEELSFEAFETITFTAEPDLQHLTLENITLQGKNIDIKKEETTLQIGLSQFPCTEIKQNEDLGTYSFCFGDEVKCQNNLESIILTTVYNGKIIPQLEGFYQANYVCTLIFFLT